MLAVGELVGPIGTGWALKYMATEEWCGVLAGVGVLVVVVYVVTFVGCGRKKRIETAFLEADS